MSANLKKASKELVLSRDKHVSASDETKRAMGALHRSDRLETLSYAFEIALKAARQERGPFNIAAGLAALSGGYIELQGTADQIHAQLKLIQGVSALFERVCQSRELSSSLSAQERIETISYAFAHAEQHGNTANGFYADRAVQSLENKSLRLGGSPEQIEAKLVLIKSAAALIERACYHEISSERPPQAMRYLRSESRQRGDQESLDQQYAQEARDKEMYEMGVLVGRKSAPKAVQAPKRTWGLG